MHQAVQQVLGLQLQGVRIPSDKIVILKVS